MSFFQPPFVCDLNYIFLFLYVAFFLPCENNEGVKQNAGPQARVSEQTILVEQFFTLPLMLT
jgi:hypothetical protein